MAKKNEVKKEEGREEVLKEVVIAPLTQEFSNGDMNVLRDKINEIIARG